MDVPIWINALITILSTGGVGVILYQQIKSQREQLDFVKMQLEVMKGIVQVYDPDKLKKHIEILSESGKITAEKEMDAKMMNEVFPFIRKMQQEWHEEHVGLLQDNIATLERTNVEKAELEAHLVELAQFVIPLLVFVPDDVSQDILDIQFPETGTLLKRLLEKVDDSQKEQLRQKVRMFLNSQSQISDQREGRNDDHTPFS